MATERQLGGKRAVWVPLRAVYQREVEVRAWLTVPNRAVTGWQQSGNGVAKERFGSLLGPCINERQTEAPGLADSTYQSGRASLKDRLSSGPGLLYVTAAVLH